MGTYQGKKKPETRINTGLRPDQGVKVRAKLWLHGHLHCPIDYVKNGCRVVANPLGYARKGEQDGFKPDFLIEIGP